MTLKQLRENAGITQFQACVEVGASIATLSRWESGESRLPADIVPELARVYKVTSDDILDALKTNKKAGA